MRQAFVTDGVGPTALRALNYAPEIEAFKGKGVQHKSMCLGELVARMGESYGKVFTRFDCDRAHGEELITQGDMFAAEPEGRYIRGDVLPRIEDHRVFPWDVLIAAAGTLGETELYGRCIIADGRITGRIVGPHAMKLTFRTPGSDPNLFTYAFFNTQVGIRLLRSTSFGTKILGMREDLLRSLPIPLPDDATQKRVADLIRTTVTERERYLREVKEARACIEALPEMQEASAMCQERKARCVVWDGDLPTMTAWTYSSSGQTLAALKGAWTSRLGDIVEENGVFRGGRNIRLRCEPPHGIEFFSQRDAFLIRPIPQRVALSESAIQDTSCEEGWLLVGGQGTLGEGEIFGRVVLVGDEWVHCAITEHLLRVVVDRSYSEVAFAFLSTIVGLRLLRSCAVGTKLMSLRPDLLRALPFPDLPPTLHARVTAHVQSAMQARAAATAADREAIRIVEEEVLPAWLA